MLAASVMPTGFGDLLAHAAAAPQVPRPAPADLSTIGYTSGTTGHPKGAMQSHRAVFLNTAAIFAMHTRTDRDVMLNALPLPHVYGNVIMNGTFMVGATLVMMERFDPAISLAEIQRHRATVFDGVPTMYAMMLADPALSGADLSSLRICTVGGQTMPAAKMAEWEERAGVPLLEIWGMTELAGAGTTPRWPWSPSARYPTTPTVSWPGPTWCSAPAPPPPRPRSSSTAGATWPPTSCRARSGSCPTSPRPRPARSCAGS
ncbi:MAG TPA: AMP-binding protein [Streptosporangiaceae bacterium]|nr:AMP-binding protein [Streptosporangiaceae bacterium]